MTYPGGKSGPGIFQRLINMIPPHDVLVSAFAGHCGIVRNIRPAEHTIVIDADEAVCQWWDDWRRKPEGRTIAIHHCDAIEWMRHRFNATEYSAAPSVDAEDTGAAATRVFAFVDPPYVLSERASGKQYACELTDSQHFALLRILTHIDAATATDVMACGYRSTIYASLERWRTIDHQVPTRGGLQDEAIWMNYDEPDRLHDPRFIGCDRRERERIRRRQINWRKQLDGMSSIERQAMMEYLEARDA